ncbi:helix-hairpin-helix domain-containing protein [Haloferax denitrificans]|uniref:helix-hairpin-helix domain-containing protein n=1 Tax=Haloferax denitrificans TaxID=35745 RepID=UPI000677C496|nr:helix-hairpin-helix domain-containing protein [Haloferax denitrificans]
MKVYLTDGTSFECGGYKALDSGGVVLTADKKRKRVVGYVPADALVYVLPDDVEPGDSLAGEGDGNGNEDGDGNDDTGDAPDESDDEARGPDDANGENDADGNGDANDADESETEVDADESETEVDADESETEADADESGDEAGDGGVADSDGDGSVQTTAEAGVDPGVTGVTGAADGETEHTHADLVERIGTVESRVDGLDGRVDAMTEQLAAVVEADRDPEDPRNIRGIGEAYATRLRAAGIDTVSALREASDEELAAAADVSARRVADWKRRAERYAERPASDRDGDSEPGTDATDTERDADADDAADSDADDAADDATGVE